MKPTNGNVLISVETTVMEKIGVLFQDIRFEKHAKMVIHGIVVAAPEFGNNEDLYEEFEGDPRRKAVRSNRINASEIKSDIQVGDKVYYHYLTLEDEQNFVMHGEGAGKLYRVPVSDIFCYVRDGKINMNLNWVLGLPDWGDVQDLGDGLKGQVKTLDSGVQLVTSLAFKPQVDIAKISHIGPGVYCQRSVAPGDTVLLTPNCEFENTIEGVKYWCFKHEDIIAVERAGLTKPCGDWVIIHTSPKRYTGNLHANHDYLQIPFHGQVFEVGDKPCLPLSKGDRVLFSQRDMRMVTHNLILLSSANIQCHEPQEQAGE